MWWGQGGGGRGVKGWGVGAGGLRGGGWGQGVKGQGGGGRGVKGWVGIASILFCNSLSLDNNIVHVLLCCSSI